LHYSLLCVGLFSGELRCFCIFEAEVCIFETEVCIFEVKVCVFEAEVCIFEAEVCILEAEVCIFEAEVCIFEAKSHFKVIQFSLNKLIFNYFSISQFPSASPAADRRKCTRDTTKKIHHCLLFFSVIISLLISFYTKGST